MLLKYMWCSLFRCSSCFGNVSYGSVAQKGMQQIGRQEKDVEGRLLADKVSESKLPIGRRQEGRLGKVELQIDRLCGKFARDSK